MLEIGTLVDNKYKILAEVGHGGMSTVYLALNEKANKQWAIKEILKEQGEEKQNLITEANILKNLSNPHLPSIVDIIEEEDKYLIVMDYVEGITLRKKLRNEGPLPQEDVVAWMLQMCDVFIYLHNQNPPIIYKDLKPSNIMLRPDGTAVLIDFGAARIYKGSNVEDTSKLGTSGYAAPEQFDNPKTDPRTDIYTMGTTMFHLLTGKTPALTASKSILDINANLSSGLASIIDKCTQYEKEDRYQSCEELKRALENYKSLETGYLKKEKKQFASMVVSAVLSVICFIMFFMINSYQNKLNTETYDYYIRMAKSAATQEQAVDYYEEAIALDTDNEEAYLDLLTLYLDDNEFSGDEATQLIEILGYSASNSNNTNESLFKTNKEGYDNFAFQLGLAYFYYQESGKPSSEPWFYIAKESNYLSSSQIRRAEILYKIAGYYSELTSLNLAGDSSVSYKTYFEDLTSFLDYNLVEEDNIKTALVTYNEVVVQILNNAYNFSKAGVTEEELTNALLLIEKHIETDIDEIDESDEETLETINKNIEMAYITLEATFQEVE